MKVRASIVLPHPHLYTPNKMGLDYLVDIPFLSEFWLIGLGHSRLGFRLSTAQFNETNSFLCWFWMSSENNE